jgi:hypothetical protein
MDWRAIIHDWRISCKEVMCKNETEIDQVNKIYDKIEPTASILHVVYSLTKHLIFDKYSELVSQVNKEIAIRILLKISKDVYTRNISYKSNAESELFRSYDNSIEID